MVKQIHAHCFSLFLIILIIDISFFKNIFRELIKPISRVNKITLFCEKTLIIDLNFILFKYLLLEHLDRVNLIVDLEVPSLGKTNLEIVHIFVYELV